MHFTQLRNATARIRYAGMTLLLDPVLADQGAYPGFAGTANSHLRNPLTPLPLPVDDILQADAVIITHTHTDHWDEAAARLIPKGKTIFAQHEEDAAIIREAGFTDVRIFGNATPWAGITLTRTGGQHGSDAIMAVLGQRLGVVSGVVLRHPDEKTLYLAGDTVWNKEVAAALEQHRPEVIVVNCGDAQVPGLGNIIMNSDDVLRVAQAAPQARIVASHMEAMNHCLLSREELRRQLDRHSLRSRVLVPADGETCTF